jgi:hypothetical protein
MITLNDDSVQISKLVFAIRHCVARETVKSI